jgi:hypothetical protein
MTALVRPLTPLELTEATNNAFHESYHQLMGKIRLEFGTRQFPVIVKHQENLILFFDGVLHKAVYSHESYDRLKAISHLPFGLYLVLVANGYGALEQATLDELADYRRLAQIFGKELAHTQSNHDWAQNCGELLSLSIEAIDSLCQSQRLSEADVSLFSSRCRLLFQENIRQAAQLELDQLHAQVNQWREMMSEAAWQRLLVVICVGHQARHREMAVQYFRKLLDEPEGINAENEERVICAEAISDFSAALDLLARHIIDQQSSRAFFGNTTQLQRDLLSDASTQYLPELFLRTNL